MSNPFSRFFRRRKPDPLDSHTKPGHLLTATIQVIVVEEPRETFSERASEAMTKAIAKLSDQISRAIYVIADDGQVEAYEVKPKTPIQ